MKIMGAATEVLRNSGQPQAQHVRVLELAEAELSLGLAPVADDDSSRASRRDR